MQGSGTLKRVWEAPEKVPSGQFCVIHTHLLKQTILNPKQCHWFSIEGAFRIVPQISMTRTHDDSLITCDWCIRLTRPPGDSGSSANFPNYTVLTTAGTLTHTTPPFCETTPQISATGGTSIYPQAISRRQSFWQKKKKIKLNKSASHGSKPH